MIMEKLDYLLRALDVEGTSPNLLLEADLGLDFHERQCLREDLEDDLQVVIADDDLKNDMTVLEFAGLLSRKSMTLPGIDNFGGKLVEDAVIFAVPEIVNSILLDIDAWPKLMPHVRNVRTTYDDGTYQEFTMDAGGAGGNFVPVRSVRRSEPGHIAYFLPVPPPFLKHCCGDWFIRSLGRGATHLTIVLRWTLTTGGQEALDGSARAEALLGEWAKVALAAVKSALEENVRFSEIGQAA
nr:SRPBCC family protein [uncultured Rhodopila sp.]